MSRDRGSYWKDKYNRRKEAGLCTGCGGVNDSDTEYKCTRCRKRYRERENARTRSRFRQQRDQVFDHYGRECVCCGEGEPMFLQIDHINNDGANQRRSVIDRNLYHHIIKAGFPDDLQVLCANCNHGKHRNGGVCPHKTRT